MADFVAASDLLSLRFLYPDGKDFLVSLQAPEKLNIWYQEFINIVPAAREVHEIIGKIADASHNKNRHLFEAAKL